MCVGVVAVIYSSESAGRRQLHGVSAGWKSQPGWVWFYSGMGFIYVYSINKTKTDMLAILKGFQIRHKHLFIILRSFLSAESTNDQQ